MFFTLKLKSPIKRHIEIHYKFFCVYELYVDQNETRFVVHIQKNGKLNNDLIASCLILSTFKRSRYKANSLKVRKDGHQMTKITFQKCIPFTTFSVYFSSTVVLLSNFKHFSIFK